MELRVPVLRVEVYCLGFGAYDVLCKGVAQLYGDFVLEPCRLDVSGVPRVWTNWFMLVRCMLQYLMISLNY